MLACSSRFSEESRFRRRWVPTALTRKRSSRCGRDPAATRPRRPWFPRAAKLPVTRTRCGGSTVRRAPPRGLQVPADAPRGGPPRGEPPLATTCGPEPAWAGLLLHDQLDGPAGATRVRRFAGSKARKWNVPLLHPDFDRVLAAGLTVADFQFRQPPYFSFWMWTAPLAGRTVPEKVTFAFFFTRVLDGLSVIVCGVFNTRLVNVSAVLITSSEYGSLWIPQLPSADVRPVGVALLPHHLLGAPLGGALGVELPVQPVDVAYVASRRAVLGDVELVLRVGPARRGTGSTAAAGCL